MCAASWKRNFLTVPVLVSTNVSPILCFMYEFAGRVLTLWFVEVEKNKMKRSFAQRVGNFCLLSEDIQLRAKQTAPLVNKHYQNEVTLTGQNPPLKCC